jgi:hypothetical protein
MLPPQPGEVAMPHNTKPDTNTPPTNVPPNNVPPNNVPPTTAEGVTTLLKTLKLQREAFQSQLDKVNKAQFDLAGPYTLNDPEAVKQMEQLAEVEAKVQQHLRLCDVSIQQSIQLHQVLTQQEAANAEVDRKRSYERLLLQAVEEAKHADQAIQTYASHMKAREALLEQAQNLALHVHELGQLRQVRGPQGPSWQLGHYGVSRLIDYHAFSYHVGFQPLAIYSEAMLPGYNLQDTPPAAPPAAPTPTPPAQENKYAKSKRPN